MWYVITSYHIYQVGLNIFYKLQSYKAIFFLFFSYHNGFKEMQFLFSKINSHAISLFKTRNTINQQNGNNFIWQNLTISRPHS